MPHLAGFVSQSTVSSCAGQQCSKLFFYLYIELWQYYYKKTVVGGGWHVTFLCPPTWVSCTFFELGPGE